MYCRQCHKEIVVMGISPGAATGDEIEAMRRSMEEDGKLALFNPPPVGPYRCPVCGSDLEAWEGNEQSFAG